MGNDSSRNKDEGVSEGSFSHGDDSEDGEQVRSARPPVEEEVLRSRADMEFDESSEEGEEDGESNPVEREIVAREEQGGDLCSLVVSRSMRRAEQGGAKLKEYLGGKVALVVSDANRMIVFDWSKNEAHAQVQPIDSTVKAQMDCVITTREEFLDGVTRGRLNPQIAMLSDKFQVSGSARLAMYFFNMVVPR